MRILLVQPPTPPAAIGGDDWFIFEPLALEYLAAAVRGTNDVIILDLRFGGSMRDALESFQPDLVGITGYTVHVNTMRSLCETVKRWNAQAVTVVGGHHATVAPGDFADPGIDLVVVGEGVHPFREIVERMRRGASLTGIPSVGVAGHPPASAPPAYGTPAHRLDGLPRPARDLTAAWRSRYFCDWMKPIASIRTSKGCPHRCRFCVLWKLTGGRYLRREPDDIVAELAEIAEPYVFFCDDESLLDARRMLQLAELIRDAGIRKQYFLYGRSDTIARHPELLAAWRSVGLARVFVGLEFHREEDLAYVGKSTTLRDNDAAVRILHDLGIEVYACFMLRPDFERRHFVELRRYSRALRLDYPLFTVLTPLVGTDLYEDLRSRLVTGNSDYCDFIHTLLPTRIPLRDFYRHYAWLLRTALPPRKKLDFIRKFPIAEIEAFLARSLRVRRAVRNAWRDYEQLTQGTVGAAKP
jgi:radical SAM superfamily enzyme YgiQ (UPF0313 family)